MGDVAQVGERLPCTEEVRGSSPRISTGRLLGQRVDGSELAAPVGQPLGEHLNKQIVFLESCEKFNIFIL